MGNKHKQLENVLPEGLILDKYIFNMHQQLYICNKIKYDHKAKAYLKYDKRLLLTNQQEKWTDSLLTWNAQNAWLTK